MTYVFSRFEYSARQKAILEEQKMKTALSIVEGGGTTSAIWVYVRNTGQAEIDVNGLAFFVDGRFVGTCETLSCVELGITDGYLTPSELLEINAPGSYALGAHKVRVVTSNGVYDETTVVVG